MLHTTPQKISCAPSSFGAPQAVLHHFLELQELVDLEKITHHDTHFTQKKCFVAFFSSRSTPVFLYGHATLPWILPDLCSATAVLGSRCHRRPRVAPPPPSSGLRRRPSRDLAAFPAAHGSSTPPIGIPPTPSGHAAARLDPAAVFVFLLVN